MEKIKSRFTISVILVIVSLFSVILAFTLGMQSTPAYAAKYNFKLGHESAPNSMQDQFAYKFKEYVERESKGDITISIFPSDQIGDPFALLQGVQSGVIDLGIFNGGSIATVLKDYAMFSIPAILPKSLQENKKIFESDFVRTLVSNTEKTGVKYLGAYIEPFFQVTANKEITKIEDFKGLKIRTMNSPIIIATYKALGANPTPIPFSEVYSSLQTRLIDAQENPLDIIYEMSFHEVQKYLVLTNHSTVINFLCSNGKLFTGMPDGLQRILVEGGRYAQNYMFEEVPTIEKQGYQSLEKTGKITILESTPEIAAAYKKAAEEAKKEYFKLVGKTRGMELLDSLEAAMKALR